MIKRSSVLLMLFIGLVGAAVIAGKFGVELFSGLIGAVLGAVATAFVSDMRQQEIWDEQYDGALRSLRAEIEFNQHLLLEPDQKRIMFSTQAWVKFSEYLNEIAEPSRKNLFSLYGYISRHTQAVQVELVRTDQGPTLHFFAEKISELCRAIQADGISRREGGRGR